MALQGFPHVLPEPVAQPEHALTSHQGGATTLAAIALPSLLSFAFVRLQRRVENETSRAHIGSRHDYTLGRPPFLSCISTSNVNTRSNDSSQACARTSPCNSQSSNCDAGLA